MPLRTWTNHVIQKSISPSAGRGYCETALPRTINPFEVGAGVYSVNIETSVCTENLSTVAFVVD